MTTLLIPYGLVDGRIVHVDDVQRGKACGARCAGCDSELVAKKGEERIHHFAHYQANGHECEGWLHKTAKRILYERITQSIARRSSFPIKWSCSDEEPAFVHEVDLLGKGVLNNASLEQYLPTWNIRPDITLMAGDTPKGLIEVVDSHRPESPVLASGLPVLEVHVFEGPALEVLAKGTIPVAVMHNYPCPEPSTRLRADTPLTRLSRLRPCSECGEIVVQGENAVYTNWAEQPSRNEAWYCRPCYVKTAKNRCMNCGETLTGRMAYTYTAYRGWQLYSLTDFVFRRNWCCRDCYTNLDEEYENVTALGDLMQEPPGQV